MMNSPDVAGYVSTKVRDIRRLAPDVLCVSLSVPPGFLWEPGQHVAVTDQAGGRRSYYSIASAHGPVSDLELAVHEPSIKWSGPVEVGRTLLVSAPSGGPSTEHLHAASELVLVGMGTGVAPLRPIVQTLVGTSKQARSGGPHVTLLQGARDLSRCIFFDEFNKLAGPRFNYLPVLSQPQPSDGWSGVVGRVQAHVGRVPVLDARYCICGKLAMVSEVAGLLLNQGVSPEHIFSEGY